MVGRGGESVMIAALLPPGALVEGAEVLLPEEERHHLKVRRASVGDTVRLHDGCGARGLGMLLGLGSGAAVRVESVGHVPPPRIVRLVVGAGDRERFAWMVEKAAELGVSEVVPLESALVHSVASRVRASHLDKFRRQALEGIKQSGAAWAPVVRDLHSPAEACAAFVDGTRWLADGRGGSPSVSGTGPLTIVVGPEGGLTDTEHDQFVAAGFQPTRLGPHVLRFETAAIAGAVMAQAHLAGVSDE